MDTCALYEETMGKYDQLESHLSMLGNGTHTMLFSDIETIIGDMLPKSASTLKWWDFLKKPLSDNLEVKQIDLDETNQSVTFEVSSVVNEYEYYKKSQMNFDLRWGIEGNDSVENFKARVLLELGDILGTLSTKKEFCVRFYSVIGKYPKIVRRGMFDSDDYQLLNTFELNNDFKTTIKYIQACLDILNQLEWYEELLLFEEAVERLVGISRNPPFLIYRDERTGTVELHRAGAKLLDTEVITADLHWLIKFPKVASLFNRALNLFQTFDGSDEQARNIYDQLRVSLEALLQAILDNKKTLDNNKSSICDWLKTKGAHPNVVKIFGQLISQFDDFMNDPKHGRVYQPNDLEFMLYLTGILMRAILEKSQT